MKTTAFKTAHEISRLGFAALVEKLGPGGALQFLQQYESGRGDYTKERRSLFAGKKVDDIWNEMKLMRRRRRVPSDALRQG
jgi:hypothetical protein